MNRSRKIQIALGTILLWSSTTVSSFAATNINPGKNQLNTVNLPVESIPSSQLNLTPDTNLIAQSNGDLMYKIARQIDDNNFIGVWEDFLTKRESTETIKKTILEFCPSTPQELIKNCWMVLVMWSFAKQDQILESRNYVLVRFLDVLDDINRVALEETKKYRN